jgi:ABC-type xylose transport system permease subunit
MSSEISGLDTKVKKIPIFFCKFNLFSVLQLLCANTLIAAFTSSGNCGQIAAISAKSPDG